MNLWHQYMYIYNNMEKWGEKCQTYFSPRVFFGPRQVGESIEIKKQ